LPHSTPKDFWLFPKLKPTMKCGDFRMSKKFAKLTAALKNIKRRRRRRRRRRRKGKVT
jgi:hypothetical protein